MPGHPGLRANGWGAGIRYALSGQGWYGQLVRYFVESALVRLGGPAGLWHAALLAGLGEIAATAVRHRDLLMQLISEAAL